MMTESTIEKVAIVGTGVIGGGWAARALAAGLDVTAWDPAPGAEDRLRAGIDNAWPALTRVGLADGAGLDRLKFVPELADAVGDADFIQESAPENEELKRALMAKIDAAARADVLIASSSSGLLPSRFQADCRHPERVVVGHPFNPVYLLPLVEVLGGEKTAPDSIERAAVFYKSIGMRPLKVRTEIPGYIADRLQEALWRELLHLVADGVATTAEIDDAIRFGPGLRWAFMGTSLIYHLAGGDQGMRHMLAQFGPALKLPWTKLEAPELTDELIGRMADGTMEQAAGRSIKELERYRDDALISIQETVRQVKARHGMAADE
jgi:carnitine 3-dehydrogenase